MRLAGCKVCDIMIFAWDRFSKSMVLHIEEEIWEMDNCCWCRLSERGAETVYRMLMSKIYERVHLWLKDLLG